MHPAMGATPRQRRRHRTRNIWSHEQAIATLATATAALLDCLRARCAGLMRCYRQLALFVAHNFGTYDQERRSQQRRALGAPVAMLTTATIEARWWPSIPPDENAGGAALDAALMAPKPEARRHAGDMRRQAPGSPSSSRVLQIVRPHLSASEWAKLGRALEQ